MSAFFEMGGYAAFVWPSYGVSILILGLMIAFSVSGHRRAQAEIRRLEERDEGDGP